MEPDSVGAKFSAKVYFPVGKTEFKFKLNDRIWSVSDFYKTVDDGMGGLNNIINVKPMSMTTSVKPKMQKLLSFKDTEKTINFGVNLFELLDCPDLHLILGNIITNLFYYILFIKDNLISIKSQ